MGKVRIKKMFLKFSCEIAHSGKSLISGFQGFLLVLTKLSFWQGDWVIGYHSMKSIEFLLPSCYRTWTEVSIAFNLFSSCRRFSRSFSLSSWSRLMTVYFKLIISSLTLFIFLIIISSRFWRDSLATAESFLALVLCSCIIIDNTAVILIG